MYDKDLFDLAATTLIELREASAMSPIDDLTEDNGVIRDFMSIVDQVKNNPNLGNIFTYEPAGGPEGSKFPRTIVHVVDDDGVIAYDFQFGEIRRGRFSLTVETCLHRTTMEYTMLFNRSCFTPEQEAYMLLEGMINLE